MGESRSEPVRRKGMPASTPPGLPRFVATAAMTARGRVMVSASLACGAVACAGFYPTFDEGKLRLVLGFSSALLAPIVIHVAMNSPLRKFAVLRALMLATAFGPVSTLLPAAILLSTSHGGDVLGVVCTLGVILGLPTGLAYGVPLAILVHLTHPLVRAGTYDARDRIEIRAGAWTAVGGAFALALAIATCVTTKSFGESFELVPAAVAILILAIGSVTMTAGYARLRQRAEWVKRVRQGVESEYRLRPLEARDPVDRLPCLSRGASVIEWRPTMGEGAYRSAAVGTALAIVED